MNYLELFIFLYILQVTERQRELLQCLGMKYHFNLDKLRKYFLQHKTNAIKYYTLAVYKSPQQKGKAEQTKISKETIANVRVVQNVYKRQNV